jgi:hypothetical protein
MFLIDLSLFLLANLVQFCNLFQTELTMRSDSEPSILWKTWIVIISWICGAPVEKFYDRFIPHREVFTQLGANQTDSVVLSFCKKLKKLANKRSVHQQKYQDIGQRFAAVAENGLFVSYVMTTYLKYSVPGYFVCKVLKINSKSVPSDCIRELAYLGTLIAALPQKQKENMKLSNLWAKIKNEKYFVQNVSRIL